MKPGKSLEQLVQILERALAANQAISITAPCKLRDTVTGSLREHDVVLTIKQSHHQVLVALECRERSRKVSVDQVEAFHQKCLTTGINKGIIVSTRGFHETARTKATHYGIRCLMLDEVKNLRWLAMDHIVGYHREIIHVHWHVYPKAPYDAALIDITQYDIIDANQAVIDLRKCQELVRKNVDAIEGKEPSPGTNLTKIRFNTPDLSLKHRTTGQTMPLDFLIADVTQNVTCTQSPIKLVSYEEQGHPKAQVEAGIATVEAGPIRGKLVISKEADKEIRITFVPDNKPQ